MKVINFDEHKTLLSQYMSELRDKDFQQNRLRFRTNLERIGEIMAYEISKTLDYCPKDITTPLGTAHCNVLKQNVVLGTIFRAGLPFHQGFLRYIDNAENAFVSAYRKYSDNTNFDIHIEYIASPNITGKTLILVDPMLATGSSMELAYQALLTKGTPDRVILASVIASRQAVDYLHSKFPTNTVSLYVAAIDEEINSHKYIIPGLGDAGDLAFGVKD